MIEARNLSKSFGPTAAVRELSFRVEKGEVVGFLGPNGAGKTTTMRMLTGSLTPSDGGASVGGYDLCENPIEAKRLIGYLPESPPLYTDLTVTEYLRFAASLKGVAPREVGAAVDRAVDACGLGDVRKRLIGNLSKGYRQRTGLAQALVHDPKVLVLDEPTVGLDPKQIAEIRDLIKRLGEDRTIILSTHILSEVTMTCEKVMIIHRGSLVAEDSIENLQGRAQGERLWLDIRGHGSESEVLAAYGGLGGVLDASVRDGGFELSLDRDSGIREKIAPLAVEKGWKLLEMRLRARSLEDVFLELTGNEEEAASPEEEGES